MPFLKNLLETILIKLETWVGGCNFKAFYMVFPMM